MITTPNKDDRCGLLDLKPGTYHVHGRKFVVRQWFGRRFHWVDGLWVNRVVFDALLATALILARVSIDTDNTKGDK